MKWSAPDGRQFSSSPFSSPSQAFVVSSTGCHRITLKPHVLSLCEGSEAVEESASNLDVRLERFIEDLSESDGSGDFSGRTS